MMKEDRDKLRLEHQSLVGSINWLAHTKRPDLAAIVPILAQCQNNPSPGHYQAGKHVVKYLSDTKDLRWAERSPCKACSCAMCTE